MTILPDWLEAAKAEARTALAAKQECEAAARALNLDRNRKALLEAVALDLPAALVELAGGLERVATIGPDFSGLTTSYLFSLQVPGYRVIQVHYVRAGPAWVRGVWDVPSDDPLEDGPPLWRIYGPSGLLHARGLGSALALAEVEEMPPF